VLKTIKPYQFRKKDATGKEVFHLFSMHRFASELKKNNFLRQK
jgi:hypothetical protein